MKSVLEYLHECKQMAGHNRLCYSATYGMNTPKHGYEKEFKEAVRDGEIVDELIAMVSNQERIRVQNHSNGNDRMVRIPKHMYVDDGSRAARQRIMETVDFFEYIKTDISLLAKSQDR